MRRKARKLARKGPCRVYWATHGCDKQRGHIGRHYCGCGTYLTEDVNAFGEDWAVKSG